MEVEDSAPSLNVWQQYTQTRWYHLGLLLSPGRSTESPSSDRYDHIAIYVARYSLNNPSFTSSPLATATKHFLS